MSEWSLTDSLDAAYAAAISPHASEPAGRAAIVSHLRDALLALGAAAPSPWQPIATMPTEDWHSRRPDGGGVCVARFTQTNRAAFFVWIDPKTEKPTHWAPLLPSPSSA